MELLGGPLNKFIPSMDNYQIACNAHSIASALSHLHRHGTSYGLLSIHDIMVTKSGEVKLGSFSFNNTRTNLETTVDNAFGLHRRLNFSTFRYCNASFVGYNYSLNNSARQQNDVHALGEIILEMCTKRMPFEKSSDDSMLTSIQAGEHEPIPSDCPPRLASLVKLCREPSTTAEQVEKMAEEVFSAYDRFDKAFAEASPSPIEVQFIPQDLKSVIKRYLV